jgi:hypothetical protein
LQQLFQNHSINSEKIQSSLWWALRKGYSTTTKLLLNADGTSFDYDERGQYTPLSLAIDIISEGAGRQVLFSLETEMGNITIVELLLTRSDDINSKDGQGRPPLF